MHKVQDKPANAKEVLKFFDWAFKNGEKMAEELDYVPLPDIAGHRRSRAVGTPRSRTRRASRSG